MKRKFFIDFDGTLFDTKKLKEDMFQLCYNVGFTHDEIIGSYKAECDGGLFSRNHFIERLSKLKEFDVESVKSKLSDLIADSNKYLFADTESFLAGLDREKYEVNILTLGVPDFQREKVEHSGIAIYFDNIYYVVVNKWEVMDDYVGLDEKFVFVDDREDTVANISKLYPHAVSICIDRRDEDTDDPMRQVKEVGILKVGNFSEVAKVVKETS